MHYDEWISFWAKTRPDQLAVVMPNGGVRYGEFEGHINKVAQRLQGLGLRPGAIVAVDLPDEYVHWLVLLALDRLGLASVSIANASPQHPMLLALKPELLVTTAEGAGKTSIPSLAVTPEWYRETMALPPSVRPRRERRPDEIVHFFSSSGSTGKPKVMALTRAQLEARVDQGRLAMGAGRLTCGCTLFGINAGPGYTWPLAYWSGGGCNLLNLGFAASLPEELRRLRPTQVMLSVGTLLELVRGPVAKLPPIPGLALFCVGSVLPKALADEARRVLTPDVNVCYAATEASGIAYSSPALLQQYDGTAAVVSPLIEVEVVDADDRPLPAGSTGVLRVRSACLISGYWNEDRPATDSPLRNGWFYPGDVGSLSADRVLVVTGRITDVLNIGGNKFFPQAIEEVSLGCAGIRDAAAFSLPDKFGVERPWVALVRGDDYKAGEVAGRVRARWPLLGELQVAVMAAIPRNQMGKIDRLKLREQGLQQMRSA